MKRIVRIERRNKRHDGRASTLEEIDSTVALIQALIPLGLHAVGEALEAEVVALAGAGTAGRGDAPAWSAGGSTQTRSTSPIRSCPSRSLACAIGARTERSREPRTNGCKSRGQRMPACFGRCWWPDLSAV